MNPKGVCQWCGSIVKPDWDACWVCAPAHTNKPNSGGYCSYCATGDTCTATQRYCVACQEKLYPVTDEQITAALQDLQAWVEG